MAESEEELTSLLLKVKEESEKVGLKLNIQNTKIMASDPIPSWQIGGGKNENSERLFWGGSRIIAYGNCSHEIKRYLLFGRKVMTNLDSILKSRDITLPTKVCCSQSYGFSSSRVQMWELDNKKRLSTEELMPLNCGVGEDSFESLGLQGDPNNPS